MDYFCKGCYINGLGSIPFPCKENNRAVLSPEVETTATRVLNMRLGLLLSLRLYENLCCLSLPKNVFDKKLVRYQRKYVCPKYKLSLMARWR
jgi:hypothetical protein